jgi:transcriptional regulator
MPADKTDVLQGTLALMILKTLDTIGPQHGYGIARRIEQMSGDQLQLNQGTLYPALVRLEQAGWIRAKWGASENNRRAKFYNLTPRGARRLAEEARRWETVSGIVERFLAPATGRRS